MKTKITSEERQNFNLFFSFISPTSYQRKRFTLIELLVVVAIIAILAGMLLPALNQAKLKAQDALCRSNFKTATLAVRLYGDTYNDVIPPIHTGNTSVYGTTYGGLFWIQFLNKLGIVYTGQEASESKNMYRYMCPLVPREKFIHPIYAQYSWANNSKMLQTIVQNISGWINIKKYREIKHPAEVFHMAETMNSPADANPSNFDHAYNLYNVQPASAPYSGWFDLIRHKGHFNLFYIDGHVDGRTLQGIPRSDGLSAVFWKDK